MDLETYNKMKEKIYSKHFICNLIKNINNPNILFELSKKYKVGDGSLLEYIEYLKKIKQYFSLQQNIVEMACGNYPIMSELINFEQQTGSITAYDFDLNINYPTKVKLKKEYIKEETDLSKFNLIFSIFPCCSSELFLLKAHQYNLDFFLAMCDCPPYYGKYQELENFHLFKKSEINIEYLEQDKRKVLPIIIRKK